MAKTLSIIAILLIIASAVIATIFMRGDSKKVMDKEIVESILEDSAGKSDGIPENWKMYSNENMGFSMYYDPSLILKEDTKNDVRFHKYGPTQKGQTEMYDGIIVSIRKVDTAGDEQVYINNQIEQYKDVGTITEPLHDGKLNGIVVKQYSVSGLGDFKIIFAPIDNQTLLEISYMAPDPTSAGFQETVDLMLSTFNLKRNLISAIAKDAHQERDA